MTTEVVLHGHAAATANYIGWSPCSATVRLSNSTGASGPVPVTLRNQHTNAGGQVVFSTATQAAAATLQLTLPTDGTPVSFSVAGKFGAPSQNDKDAIIEVVDAGGQTLSLTPLMVRIRKDATTLTAAERDRFIGALATFNNRGLGRFSAIRNMHVSNALDESHGAGDPDFHDAFLPWHRAYLLDFERQLQAIDPSVALPYWRFDKPAPQLYTADFLGAPRVSGSVRFSPTNPLKDWVSDSQLGFRRVLRFTASGAAQNANGPVQSEGGTLGQGTEYVEFVLMEGEPHGHAHVCFDGPVNNPATAPRDPLFFLLHCNVDRLWAKWQFVNEKWDPTVAGTYTFLGKAGQAGATRIGHNLLDTMWPWNGVTAFPRPNPAPGSGLQASVVANAPPQKPTVGDMLDFQGQLAAGNWHGFDYDDVMF